MELDRLPRGRVRRPVPRYYYSGADRPNDDSTTRLPTHNRWSDPFPSFGTPAEGTIRREQVGSPALESAVGVFRRNETECLQAL
ncbi:hypothetical protein GCM10017774_41800 [Lentzea cavernae]|uniref:Uncharacterized protein n=1 Tax=Lentzea cavernae TaxID=2020703 RepID=A0ABQ3MIA6_9PSEU|nr:hypothetical protein GCM10017774_41800 [Lentzea cavernae]